MSLQGAPHLSDVALTAIADNLDLEAFRLDGMLPPPHQTPPADSLKRSRFSALSRQQPADGRQLAGSVQELERPSLAPRRRVSQDERRQPQGLRRPEEPATPQHLPLQQVGAPPHHKQVLSPNVNCAVRFRVSDVGIQHLTEGPLRSLRELDVSHCRITDASVVRIVQRYEEDERLNMSAYARLNSFV